MKSGFVASLTATAGLGFVVAVAATLLLAGSAGPALALVVLLAGVVTVSAIWVRLQRHCRRQTEIVRTIRRGAEGELVVRCPPTAGELGQLATETNRLLERLTELSVNVIDTDRELQWTQKELHLQEELTEKSRLLQSTNQQLESRLKELSLLFSISRSLTTSIVLDSLLQEFCQAGIRTMEVDRFAIIVWDEAKRALVVRGLAGFGDSQGSILGMRVYPGEGVSGTVFEKKTMIYVRDLDQDQRFLHFRGKARLSGSLLVLPLPSGDRCVGVMLLNRSRREGFSFEDVGLFHIVANQVAGAVANALLYQKTLDLATQDELTGLYNRRALEERLEMEWERAVRFGTCLACIMVDVDHFKQFNDLHGHLVGDEVLKLVGAGLTQQVRRVDTVARFGGEEFVILLPRTSRSEGRAVAEKLRSAIAGTPLEFSGRSYSVTISGGVATSEGAPTSARQLVDMADHALLLAKTGGRNMIVEYGESR